MEYKVLPSCKVWAQTNKKCKFKYLLHRNFWRPIRPPWRDQKNLYVEYYALNVRSRGKQFCFPESPDVFRDEFEGNIRLIANQESVLILLRSISWPIYHHHYYYYFPFSLFKKIENHNWNGHVMFPPRTYVITVPNNFVYPGLLKWIFLQIWPKMNTIRFWKSCRKILVCLMPVDLLFSTIKVCFEEIYE